MLDVYLEVSFLPRFVKAYGASAGAFVSAAIATCVYGGAFASA